MGEWWHPARSGNAQPTRHTVILSWCCLNDQIHVNSINSRVACAVRFESFSSSSELSTAKGILAAKFLYSSEVLQLSYLPHITFSVLIRGFTSPWRPAPCSAGPLRLGESSCHRSLPCRMAAPSSGGTVTEKVLASLFTKNENLQEKQNRLCQPWGKWYAEMLTNP